MNAFLQSRRAELHWIAALVLIAAMFAPLLSVQRADAQQVTSRSIEMATSQAGATESYQISFTVPDVGAGNIGSFRVEFCDNNPLTNTSCVYSGIGDDIPNVDSATLSGTPTFDGETITMVAPTVSDQFLTFNLGSATDIGSDTTFDVTVDGIVNPSNTTDSGVDNNTFYARIYVYSTSPPGFSPSQGSANTFATTNQVHEGGIAMGTAEQITLQARVQEKLNFCVSEIDPSINCGGLGGHTGIVDLGVLDIGAINTGTAYAQLSTNAFQGAVIEYFPEDEFKVSGATCSETDIAATASSVDQCLNWDDTENVMAAATEEWGTGVSSIAIGGTTTNLVRDVLFDLDVANEYVTGDPAYGAGTTPTPGGAYDLASSAGSAVKVVDNEELVISYGATVAATTPTGFYTVTLTYIATPTF